MQKIIFATVALLVLMILDLIYSGSTFELSNSITKYFQNKFDYGDENGLVESFLLIFSILGDRHFTGILFIILWLKSGQKEQALKLISMYSFASFFGHLSKLIFIQPRPFYQSDDVRLDFCNPGFGDPSDHSLRSLVFYVILSETILFKKYRVQQNDLGVLSSINNDNRNPHQYKLVSNSDLYSQLYPNTLLSYFQYKMVLGTFIFFTGIAQAYFGVQYISQVVMGWVIGGYLLFLYYYCDLERLLDQKFTQAIYNNQVLQGVQIKEYLKLGLFFLLSTLISSLLYNQRISSENLQQNKLDWKGNFEKQPKCTEILNRFDQSFEIFNLLGTCVLYFPFYLYLCCQYTYGAYKPELYNHKSLSFKGILRSVTLLVLLISLFYVHRIIRISLQENNFNIFFQYVFRGQLFYLLFSVVLITILPIIYKILRIDLDGDLFRRITQIEQQEMEL